MSTRQPLEPTTLKLTCDVRVLLYYLSSFNLHTSLHCTYQYTGHPQTYQPTDSNLPVDP
jgi:hypothetical protein